MDGHVYTCQSTNEMLQRSINVAVNLPVLYEPQFSPPAETTVSGVEGAPLTVALVATGNPASIAYTWTRDSGQRIGSSGKVDAHNRPFILLQPAARLTSISQHYPICHRMSFACVSADCITTSIGIAAHSSSFGFIRPNSLIQALQT
uniref:Ig-like domain-containing protein n=1 Tax=Anopheles maculatus TaxID=74869 RepID=A0A182S5R6_9DIPT